MTLHLSEEESHHIYKVLRGRAGDKVEAVDSVGRLFVAELTGVEEATVLEERATTGAYGETVTLYQAVPKGRRMDLVVEKTTELGVGSIVPLATKHGVAKILEGDGKTRRWRRVAEAAARQALRLRVPEVKEVTSFAQAVREAGESGVLLHNGLNLPPLEDVLLEPVLSLFVGPEGGWSAGELEMARESGLVFASLGPYRLRSETAGIVAVGRTCAVLELSRSVGGNRRSRML